MADNKQHDTPMLDELENGPLAEFYFGHQASWTSIRQSASTASPTTCSDNWSTPTKRVRVIGRVVPSVFMVTVAESFRAFQRWVSSSRNPKNSTLRVQPPAGNHYSTDMLRQLADSWEKWGSGLVTFHGQTGNIMFIGATTENTQHFFDEINDYGFDLGGAGPCVRTAMSCVGGARCEQSCANEHKIHRTLVNNFTDDVHRPALPYKFKFKVSGCPNDCMNSIERADMAVIGTWRDDMKVDQQAWKDYVAEKGRQHTY